MSLDRYKNLSEIDKDSMIHKIISNKKINDILSKNYTPYFYDEIKGIFSISQVGVYLLNLLKTYNNNMIQYHIIIMKLFNYLKCKNSGDVKFIFCKTQYFKYIKLNDTNIKTPYIDYEQYKFDNLNKIIKTKLFCSEKEKLIKFLIDDLIIMDDDLVNSDIFIN